MYNLPQVDQDDALYHWQKAQQQCPRCKRPRSECSDPDVTWYAHQSVCFATMAQAWAHAAWSAKHKAKPFCDFTRTQWSDVQDEEHPHHFTDGVELWVDTVDHDPENGFTDASQPFSQPAVLRASQYAYRSNDEPDHQG